jgi:hypothetical protein
LCSIELREFSEAFMSKAVSALLIAAGFLATSSALAQQRGPATGPNSAGKVDNLGGSLRPRVS